MPDLKKKHGQSEPNDVSSQRILLNDLNKMNDDSFFRHLNERLSASNVKLFGRELEELSQSLAKRAEKNEKRYIRRINRALTRLEKSGSERASDYIYILRFLLKNMLDAESQEEFLVYFRSFNDIADDFRQKENIHFKKAFWKSLKRVMDTRFVFIDEEKKHEIGSYKKVGNVFLNAVASVPTFHIFFTMATWWQQIVYSAKNLVRQNPFAPPPISLKEKITHFIARHTKKIIAVSIVLALTGAVMPFAFPFVAPLAVPIIAISSDLMAVGGLMSAAISGLIFLNEARARAKRISTRLDQTVSEINKSLRMGEISEIAKSSMAYIIEQLQGNSSRKDMIIAYKPDARIKPAVAQRKPVDKKLKTVPYSSAKNDFSGPKRRFAR